MDPQQTTPGVKEVVDAGPFPSNIRKMTETETEDLEQVYQHIAGRNLLDLKALEGLKGKDKVLGSLQQADKADKLPLVILPDNRAIAPGVVRRLEMLEEEEEVTEDGRP